MGIVLDIILAGFVLLGIWEGMRSGFVTTLIRFLGEVVGVTAYAIIYFVIANLTQSFERLNLIIDLIAFFGGFTLVYWLFHRRSNKYRTSRTQYAGLVMGLIAVWFGIGIMLLYLASWEWAWLNDNVLASSFTYGLFTKPVEVLFSILPADARVWFLGY